MDDVRTDVDAEASCGAAEEAAVVRCSCCRRVLSEECRAKNLSFQYDGDPADFVSSQWPIHPFIFLGFHSGLTVYCLYWLIASARETVGPKFFIYLTHLSCLTLNCFLVYSQVLTAVAVCKWWRSGRERNMRERAARGNLQEDQSPLIRRYVSLSDIVTSRSSTYSGSLSGSLSLREPPALPWHLRLAWLLFQLSSSLALTVTFAFWLLVLPFQPMHITAVNFNDHALNSVCVLLFLTISRYPVRLAHAWTTLAFLAAYSVFTLVYWAVGGTDPLGRPWIYELLDYGEHPAVAVALLAGVMFLVLPVAQLLLYAIFLIRRKVFDWVEEG